MEAAEAPVDVGVLREAIRKTYADVGTGQERVGTLQIAHPLSRAYLSPVKLNTGVAHEGVDA